MRISLAATVLALTVAFAGPSYATTQPNNAATATVAPSVEATIIVAQRCRCVERRWNGSCKLRVCRDHW